MEADFRQGLFLKNQYWVLGCCGPLFIHFPGSSVGLPRGVREGVLGSGPGLTGTVCGVPAAFYLTARGQEAEIEAAHLRQEGACLDVGLPSRKVPVRGDRVLATSRRAVFAGAVARLLANKAVLAVSGAPSVQPRIES